jgi:hypothetical protein
MEEDKKFVVALNRGYELPRLASGLGHVTAGLVASLSGRTDELRFGRYESADGVGYPWISDWPFIVLKARAVHLQTFRDELASRDIPHSTYLETMLSGGHEAQRSATRQRAAAEIPVLAVAAFGRRTQLDELTKKFSLWR